MTGSCTDVSDAARAVADALSLHPVTARLLVARGATAPELARAFLRPGADGLHDPALLPDMDLAVEECLRAVREGARVAVYGDYDVDGVCATAILATALRLCGARVETFLPHRTRDGYGLNAASLAGLAERGCGLVVTVDNGSTRAAEIEEAQRAGLRVVVTDHHEMAPRMPPCPVVNPRRADSRYPFPDLAGCGVALKLASALFRRTGRVRDDAIRARLPGLLALAAIGTVADVVPLLGENRCLVSLGLRALSRTKHAGLRALLEAAERAEGDVTSEDISFRLAPRLNAAGRLGAADAALELVMCEDEARAKELAADLERSNEERRRLQDAQAERALAMAREQLESRDVAALVLESAEWHAGVIGIVAARVAETFARPAALIAIDGGRGRGSARSPRGVALHEALERCREHLLTHGGHARAAGFTLEAHNVAAFREAFCEACAASPAPPPGPPRAEAALDIDDITRAVATEIAALRPFGAGNPEPVLLARGARAAGRPSRGGANERDLLFYAAGARRSVRAVAAGSAAQEALLGGLFDLTYRLRLRDSKDEPLELRVVSIRPAG